MNSSGQGAGKDPRTGKKTLLIVGAGASYDHFNSNGSPPLEWTPPLAAQLFGGHPDDPFDRDESFIPLLERYPGANVIAGNLGQKHLPNDFAFEEYLFRVANNEHMAGHFVDVPMYIRDVIYQCSVEFGHFSGNYSSLITTLCEFSNHDVFVVNLNYDTLLEQDLARLYQDEPSYKNLDDYVDPSRVVRMVKPHGSCNWFRPMFDWREHISGLDGQSFRDVFDRYGFSQAPDTTYIRDGVRSSRGAVWKDHGKRVPLYPVITAPVANKKSGEAVLPGNHASSLDDFLTLVEKVLIIGTSGHDEDLMDILNRNLGKSASSIMSSGTTQKSPMYRQDFQLLSQT